MMRERLSLQRGRSQQKLGRAPVQRLAAALQQTVVGGILDQRVIEAIFGVGRNAFDEQQPRHFLDEQRHAAAAFGDARDHALRQGMARRERDHAMMRSELLGRAEFGPGRRDDQQRRMRAALR